MKANLVLSALALALAPTLLAQEVENPGRLRLAPAENMTTTTTTTTTTTSPTNLPEVTLIPEQVPAPSTAKPATPDEPAKEEKKSKTEESAEQLMDHIHFREARTKALRDPKVMAEWARAQKAKTDFEKRDALKAYYSALYAKIDQLDPTVKKVSELRKTAALHRLEQTRIDPTEPLDPQERNERFQESQ
jgi:hypothetical protein